MISKLFKIIINIIIACRGLNSSVGSAWVGVKNFGFTEEQKNIEQGSIKLKELHVCIMRVQKKMAAWRSEVP